MSMTISLPPEEEKKLSERAAALGQDVTEYIVRLIKKDIDLLSFRELFAPVQQEVSASGISSSDLDALLESAINDSRSHGKL